MAKSPKPDCSRCPKALSCIARGFHPQFVKTILIPVGDWYQCLSGHNYDNVYHFYAPSCTCELRREAFGAETQPT